MANFSNTALQSKLPAGTPLRRLPRRRPVPSGWEHGVHLEALANLAHELRSPVQALLGYMDILRDELGESLDRRHKQILERVNANAHDLAQTVENVMDFSVADAHAEPAYEEEIKLHELIGEIAPALEAPTI